MAQRRYYRVDGEGRAESLSFRELPGLLLASDGRTRRSYPHPLQVEDVEKLDEGDLLTGLIAEDETGIYRIRACAEEGITLRPAYYPMNLLHTAGKYLRRLMPQGEGVAGLGEQEQYLIDYVRDTMHERADGIEWLCGKHLVNYTKYREKMMRALSQKTRKAVMQELRQLTEDEKNVARRVLEMTHKDIISERASIDANAAKMYELMMQTTEPTPARK